MKFPEGAGVNPQKLDELRARIARLGMDLNAVEEKFTAGGGKGGQKINRSKNCVQLRYPEHGIIIRCQRERGLALNRFLALRELADRVEMKISPETSARLARYERMRKAKASRRSRAARAPGSAENPPPEAAR
ncbi:MAG: peptide chain release factor-like protein [Elusimicrobiales bacterium]|nr:peptide chain release factor-like protein [Elusimicrobiales bacterium]